MTTDSQENQQETKQDPKEPSPDVQRRNRLAELHIEKKSLDAQTKKVNSEIAVLEPQVADDFAEQGVQNIRTNKGLLYLQKELHPSLVRGEDGSLDEAHQALRDHGLESLIKEAVNSQTLRAYVNERDKTQEPIPEGLQPYINIHEVYKVRFRA